MSGASSSRVGIGPAFGWTDLGDPATYRSFEIENSWARLHQTAQPHWTDERDGPGYWSALSYSQVVEVLKDRSGFSSRYANVLRADRRTLDPASNRVLTLMDGERHSRLRRVINRAFTPKAVESLRPHLVQVAESIASTIEHSDRVDLVRAFERLPIAALAALIRIPESDAETLSVLTQQAFGAADANYQLHNNRRATVASAYAALMDYYRELVSQRRQDPLDDPVSALARMDVDELNEQDILLNCAILAAAANETTRHAAVAGVAAFAMTPTQWALLRAGAIGEAVEEILRWSSPGLHVLRTSECNTRIGSASIAAGDQVVCWLPAANRDPAVFKQPNHFDITRAGNKHIAFGAGAHYCLGASLARLELEVLFETLARRFQTVELVEEPVRLQSNMIWGYHRLAASFAR